MSERSAAEETADGPEPTQSESRLKRLDASGEARPTRVSVRPSAFGPPRPSSPPPAPAPDAHPEPHLLPSVEQPLPRDTADAVNEPDELASSTTSEARGSAREPEDDGAAGPHAEPSSERARAPQRPTGEELTRREAEARGSSREQTQEAAGRDSLSNSQFATRLSLLSALPVESPSAQASERSRRPWRSIALFVGMLGLSAVPLLRYLKLAEEPGTSEQRTSARAGEPRNQVQGPAGELGPARDPHDPAAEAAAVEQEQQALMALVAEANRVLDAGDAPQAERLFGRVIALDEDNPRAAYGLSRIRLAQGNLSGAEGWIQLAIRKRPRRAAYHLHYAQILERLGNHDEAREEQRRAQGESEADE